MGLFDSFKKNTTKHYKSDSQAWLEVARDTVYKSGDTALIF
jgi:hypothetical protein